jgi:hypothetical protein
MEQETKETPTVSGYRRYAARSEQERQQAEDAAEYRTLYQAEQRLRDHAPGETYLSRMKSFVAELRDQQIPQINGQSERKAAIWHVKTEYQQWARDRKDLHARQRAAFERDTALAMEKKFHEPNIGGNWDALEFSARQEVIERYCGQHEALNARAQRDMSGYLDRAIDRQFETNRRSMDRNEGALLDEIVARPRPAAPTRDRDGGRER